MDKTCLSSWLIHIPLTMRLCNSRIPEEHLVCYQTSQYNWVIIKMLYTCLRWCLLSWHRSRLGFVTPIVERYLWALSVIHITISLASNATNELVAGWCITEWVKRLAGNEIELGIDTTKKYTSVMIRVCHSRSRFLSCMYIHDKFMTEWR